MSKEIPNDYIEKIIIYIKNNDKILLDPELWYVKGIISWIINKKNNGNEKLSIYKFKIKSLKEDIRALTVKHRTAILNNSLLDIKVCLNLLVTKYKELIDYVSLYWDEQDIMTIKNLSDKLNWYIIEEEKYDLLYKKFAEFILEVSNFEAEYKKNISWNNIDSESLIRLISKLKIIILKSNNFLIYLNKNGVKKLKDMLLRLEEFLLNNNSRNNSSSNSRNKKTTNLSFEEALVILWLTKEGLNLSTLKKSYRLKASKLHPDKNSWKNANEEMSLVNQARDLLEKHLK